MMNLLNAYLKYIIWVVLIAFFSYIFQVIYASGSSNLLLTLFLALSLGFAMNAAK